MKKTDLWYGKSDIKSFRKAVKEDDRNDYTMGHLKTQNRHAMIWFQTFGKFYAEPGDPFSVQHEITMFGYPLNNMQLPERFYLTAQLAIGSTPLEYRNWEDGKYFTERHNHR